MRENSAVDLETAMAERVVQVLTPVVGADHVKSSVTIEYDPTSAESTQDLYDPNATAVVSSQTSQETAQDLDPAGIPGTRQQCSQHSAGRKRGEPGHQRTIDARYSQRK